MLPPTPPTPPFPQQGRKGDNDAPGGRPEAGPDNLANAPDTKIRGFPGYYRYRGLVYEEYVPELVGVQKVDVFRRMKSDGTVAALLTALFLPIIGASWVVEPGGTDGQASRAQELVQENLFERLGASWEEEVRKGLAYLQYGFQALVTNWAIDGGEAVLHELRPLHPRTILQSTRRWQIDPLTQELLGVWQWGTDGEEWREEFIPAYQLLNLVHEPDFDNPEGNSILRAGYKHWFLCDQYYHFESIGHERGAVGVPIGYFPPGASVDLQDNLLGLCQKIQSHEQSGGILPDGYRIENFQVALNVDGLMASIHHHKTELCKSVLAQFIQLGQEGSKGGAYALSDDQSDLFLKSLQAHGDYLCSRFNRVIIPQIVGYNLATDQYPKLSCTIATKDALALSKTIVPLIINNALTIGEGDEDWFREILQMPPRELPRREPQLVGQSGAGGQGGANAPDPDVAAEENEEDGGDRTDPNSGVDGEDGSGDGKGNNLARNNHRERIVVGSNVGVAGLSAGRAAAGSPFVLLADPPSFRAEQPTYPALGEVIGQFRADLSGLLARLKKAVWQIAALPKTDQGNLVWVRDNRGLKRRVAVQAFKGLQLDGEQEKALDAAIEMFLKDYAGADRSQAGFVGTDSEDALLQGNLRLGHAVGVNRATELTGQQMAAFRPNRESPEIQKLLTDAFQRLSDNGRLRIGKQLGDIKSILVAGQENGTSPLDVARDLSGRFDQYDRYEFERLARTEMSFAANGGSIDEYRAQGVGKVQWLASGLACAICSAQDGSIVSVDDANAGDNMPPGHPSCLCTVVPVMDGE